MIPTNGIKPLFGQTLDQQLAAVRNWNGMRNWGSFSAKQFDAVDTTPSGLAGGLVVDVIVPILPDKGKGGAKIKSVQRTFDELWSVIGSSLQRQWRYDWMRSDPRHLRLLEGIEHDPGIYRMTVDLGAGKWGSEHGALPMGDMGHAGPEVLAVGAHFPGYIQAMDGDHVPYAWLRAYQLKLLNGGKAWAYRPALCWNQFMCQVELFALWKNTRDPGWSYPRVISRQ